MRISESIANRQTEITIATFKQLVRELVIAVCTSDMPKDRKDVFLELHGEAYESIVAFKVSNAFVHPEARNQDRLLAEPVLHQVPPIMPGEAPMTMFWQSAEFQAAMERAMMIAQTNNSVLISAERGSGKELFARSIHQHSNRASKELLVVNSTTIPTGIAESVLFGHS